MAVPPKAKTTSANVEAYKTLNPLLEAMYKEFQELSKKTRRSSWENKGEDGQSAFEIHS
jgi:hypothetical protein